MREIQKKLEKAIDKNDLAALLRALKKGANVNLAYGYGQFETFSEHQQDKDSCFLKAMRKGHWDLAEEMWQSASPDPLRQGENNASALFLAILSKNKEWVSRFVSQKAVHQLLEDNSEEHNVMWQAVKLDFKEAVVLMLPFVLEELKADSIWLRGLLKTGFSRKTIPSLNVLWPHMPRSVCNEVARDFFIDHLDRKTGEIRWLNVAAQWGSFDMLSALKQNGLTQETSLKELEDALWIALNYRNAHFVKELLKHEPKLIQSHLDYSSETKFLQGKIITDHDGAWRYKNKPIVVTAMMYAMRLKSLPLIEALEEFYPASTWGDRLGLPQEKIQKDKLEGGLEQLKDPSRLGMIKKAVIANALEEFEGVDDSKKVHISVIQALSRAVLLTC